MRAIKEPPHLHVVDAEFLAEDDDAVLDVGTNFEDEAFCLSSSSPLPPQFTSCSLLDPALFGPHAPDLDGSSPVGLTDCGSEDDISSVTDTLRSPEPGQHLVTPEPRVASFESGRSESFGWDAYSLSDLMDPGLDPCGSYAALHVDVDDALELDDYLNLPPSQPCSQSYDTVLPSIEPHSTPVTNPPGPATFVDGDPVQGS